MLVNNNIGMLLNPANNTSTPSLKSGLNIGMVLLSGILHMLIAMWYNGIEWLLIAYLTPRFLNTCIK